MPLKRGLSLRHRNSAKFTRDKQRNVEKDEDKENVRPNLLDSSVETNIDEEEQQQQFESKSDIENAFLEFLEQDEIKRLLAYDQCR